MEKRSLLLLVIFLTSISCSFWSLSAQENENTEKEEEQKLQQLIELQKKALADQKKARDLQIKEFAKFRIDSIRNFYRGNDYMNFFRGWGRSSGNTLEDLNAPEGPDEPFIISPGVEFSGYTGHGGDSERTTWDFSKQVKETTFSRDYSFDVEASANTVVMTIMGNCKSGQIRVKIVMPDGKLYSDIVIDESGNLNWRKSFTISENENKDKAGEWKFRIDADKATGFFKISLQTY